MNAASRPFLSVLVCVYNGEKYLRRCLDSVLSQDFRDFELIAVNDGSTDGSLAILQEYVEKDGRIKIIEHEKNRGLCRARKTAIESATGEFVTFLDGDDEFVENCLGEIASETKVKSADVVQFGMQCECGDAGAKNYIENLCKEKAESVGEALQKIFIDETLAHFACGKAFRAEIAKAAFGAIDDGRYTMGEDWMLTLLALHFAKSFASGETCLYRYHFGRGITGSRWTAEKVENQFATAKACVEAAAKIVSATDAWKKAAERCVENLCRDAFVGLFTNFDGDGADFQRTCAVVFRIVAGFERCGFCGLRAAMQAFEGKLRAVENSRTMLAGRIVTWPLKAAKKVFKLKSRSK